MSDLQTLLTQCRELGAELTPTPRGTLHVKAPVRLPESLREELKQRKAEVLALLNCTVKSMAVSEPIPIPSPPTAPARHSTAPVLWPGRMAPLATWFLTHVNELPTAPFQLGAGIHIAEPERFYTVLRLDIESGPTGARGRSGAVEDDLTALMERWAIQHEHEAAL